MSAYLKINNKLWKFVEYRILSLGQWNKWLENIARMDLIWCRVLQMVRLRYHLTHTHGIPMVKKILQQKPTVKFRIQMHHLE